MASDRRWLALFDLDGTLADFEGPMRRDLDRLAGPGEPSFEVHDRSAPAYVGAREQLIKSHPGWWLSLPRLALGFELLQLTRELDYQVQILTSGPHDTPSAWSEKVAWCHVNIDRAVRVTVTEDKRLVEGTLLVDDSPQFLADWLEEHERGWGIMPAHRSNASFRHPRVIRCDGANLAEVRARLQALREDPASSA